MKHINRFILERFGVLNADLILQQRALVFFYVSVGSLMGIVTNLLGLSGPFGIYYQLANTFHGVVILLLLYLSLCRKFSLNTIFPLLCICSQIVTSVEMFYLAEDPTLLNQMLIVGNMVLLSLMLFISIFSYKIYLPYIITFVSLVTYVCCCFLCDSTAMYNMCTLFIVLFLAIMILSAHLLMNIQNLHRENTTLHKEQDSILSLFDMDKQQINAFIHLAKQKGLSVYQTDQLLDLFFVGNNEEAKENLYRNLFEYFHRKNISVNALRICLPMLTNSELEICQLIIEGHKTGKICQMLEKTESNITCQRSKIRNKLGLQPKDDLKEALLAKLAATI